uniref:Reverse transcriptase Ty1/copia-type domain-containing protein n=1 Tax=Solanum lycopersicum TaxID=4081 RepID=A0A3Q7HB03_SOLLC
MEVSRIGSGLFLHLSKYARDLLQKAGLEKFTSQPTPMAVSSSTNGADTPFADITHFRSLIGAIQYLVITHPDIPSCQPSCSAHASTKYIFGTLGRGLLIRPGDLELRGFSDSDWANDKNNRKSTSGFLIFLGLNLVSWCTKKQPKVSRSSTEAEYRALAILAKKANKDSELWKQMISARDNVVCRIFGKSMKKTTTFGGIVGVEWETWQILFLTLEDILRILLAIISKMGNGIAPKSEKVSLVLPICQVDIGYQYLRDDACYLDGDFRWQIFK